MNETFTIFALSEYDIIPNLKTEANSRAAAVKIAKKMAKNYYYVYIWFFDPNGKKIFLNPGYPGNVTGETGETWNAGQKEITKK